MPGVSILSQSPALPSFEPQSTPTSEPVYPSNDHLSISEIKKQAQAAVKELAQGASALALIRAARDQYSFASICERDGNLKAALSGFLKAATLAQAVFKTKEYNNNHENTKKEMSRSLDELMGSNNLIERIKAVEEKLKAMEEYSSSPPTPDGPISKPGGTIADRLKSLQSNGLTISTTKRIPTAQKPTPASPKVPPSPSLSVASSSSSTNAVTRSLPSPLSISPQHTNTSTAPIPSPSPSNPHSFVSPSTLGPPSPSSSPSSSPVISHNPVSNYSLSEFKSHFPSIDELDETGFGLGSGLPSVPTGLSTGSNGSAGSTSGLPSTLTSNPISNGPISPVPSTASYLRHFDPLERPSSTPINITHITNAFGSRPGSPSSNKPLGVLGSTNGAISRSPSSNPSPLSGSSSTSTANLNVKTTIPNKTTTTPFELAKYLQEYKVLLVDVRPRWEFAEERISTSIVGGGRGMGSPVVCIEPKWLEGKIDSSTLEYRISSSSQNDSESTSFLNRNKFDLVVFYDRDSTTYGGPDSPLSVLQRVVCEREFNSKKLLRRMPMLLVGGLEAWKGEWGDVGVERIETGIERMRISGVHGTENGNGGLMNGTSVNGINGVHVNGSGGTGTHTSSTSVSSGSASTSNAVSTSTSAGVTPTPATFSPPLKSRNPFAAGGPFSSSPSFSASPSPSISASASMNGDTQYWTPSTSTVQTRGRADTASSIPASSPVQSHKSNMSLDYGMSNHSRSPAESSYGGLSRRPGLRAGLSSSSVTQTISENSVSSPITYPSVHRTTSSSPFATSSTQFDITSPPQASINPSLSRRRSDYIDQSQEALSVSGLQARPPIEYPELSHSSPHILRPPPLVASNALVERQSSRPPSIPPKPSFTSASTSSLPSTLGGLMPPVPPRINSDILVRYWDSSPIGISGLKNLGNTCYMNAPIQCLSATVPFSAFFRDGAWQKAVNTQNPMGSMGKLTGGFAMLLRLMWNGDLPYLTPMDFRKTVCNQNSQYVGTDQHDSQEFLSFLLDGIHEDLNRILIKPNITRTPEEEEKLERLPPQIASEQEWRLWRQSNDSIIVDFFQGQFRNQLKCLTCNKTSTTYNAFSILSVPIPPGRSGKVLLQKCLDAFFNTEILEKDDAWDCPKCKTKRPATKHLSLARLPPILVIHLKRFEVNGRFSDKIDTFVDFPLKYLDMTEYMPPSLPAGADHGQLNGGVPMSPDDPRTQMPPYKYELYGVTNHVGNLSSGHYTAFVASRGSWMYCDDSVIKSVDSKQVVSQKAYVLFYKRVKT